MRYKLSNEAKMDLARIYWRGVDEFGAIQAELYYKTLFKRFDDITEAPYKYPAIEHIRDGYRQSVCGVDSIYYRLDGGLVEIMRVLGRQDVNESLY
jgi:toxin ParE1/3/4